MKIMKTQIKFLIGVFLISVLSSNLLAQQLSKVASNIQALDPIEKTALDDIGMPKDALENRVQSKVLLDIDDKSAELISDGIEAVEMTQQAIDAIDKSNSSMAIDFIGGALGKLETVALRNPKMTSVPISRVVRTDDLDSDLGAIKLIKQSIIKALEENKFHLARQELESLISEVRIETTNIPISTHPDALKGALAAIEKNNSKTASERLNTVLNTLIVSKQYISLPSMRAEVLLEEALNIDSSNTDAIEKRRLLLTHAKKQTHTAYELGHIDKVSSDEITNMVDQTMKAIGTTAFKKEVRNTIDAIVQNRSKYEVNTSNNS